MHPALAFLLTKVPGARAVGAGALRLEIDGTPVDLLVASDDGAATWFAEGRTRLAYRCPSGLAPAVKERLRAALLELRAALSAARIVDLRAALPAGGGWTDGLHERSLAAWRDWAVPTYRDVVAANRSDDCAGLPDCLDLRMRPPIAGPGIAFAAPPASGPCARCGRARTCPSAREEKDGADAPKPLRHADTASGELAALRVLAAEAAIPAAEAVDAYTRLVETCGDRGLAGALPLEYSVRLPEGARRPDRLRFVSYYPLVASDSVRREINRARRAAATTLAARWLGARERGALDAWLACAADTQPDTLGLSIGVELDPTGVRLQVYAHPGPRDDAHRMVQAVVQRLGGAAESLRSESIPPVLVGIALATGAAPALKLYHPRTWETRADTGLLPDGLGALDSFNPGWGLAVQEHVDGRAAWVKWDFPVTTHYQAYDRFLAAFRGAAGAIPAWLSGEHFSPWPTWASLGRGGGRVLYFVAR